MKQNWRLRMLRRSVINSKAKDMDKPESYKNTHKSETVDPSTLTPPFQYIDGEIVDATWCKTKNKWVWK